MAAKFFTGLPMDGPDPECVLGHGEELLKQRGDALLPKPSMDHSKKLSKRQRLEAAAKKRGIELPPEGASAETPALDLKAIAAMPAKACDENPLAGFGGPDAMPAKACDESPLASLGSVEVVDRGASGGSGDRDALAGFTVRKSTEG